MSAEILKKAFPGGRFYLFLPVLLKSNPNHDQRGRFSRGSDAERAAGKLRQLVASARSGERELKHHILSAVTKEEAAKIKAATGLNVENYRHAVTNASIRHILKQHGNQSAEAGAGQAAITDEDIQRIPQIISRPSRIRKGSDTTRGDKTVVYEKRFPDGTIHYVAEVIGAGRVLHTKTMFKKV